MLLLARTFSASARPLASESNVARNSALSKNQTFAFFRAHLNDLENIPLFFVIGFVYLLTNPSVVVATWLFRLYTAARFTHTYVYAIHVIPQPARGLSWGIGYAITGYMAVQSALSFL